MLLGRHGLLEDLQEAAGLFPGQLTGGLVQLAKQRKVRVIQGVAKFESPTTLVLDSFVDHFGPPNAQYPNALDLAPTATVIRFDLKGTGDVNGFSGITPGDASCAFQAFANFDVMPPNCVFSTPPAGPSA